MPSTTLVPPTLAVRAAARVLDVILVAIVNVALGQVIGYGVDWLALGALGVLGYFALCDAGFGATLGKRALGLRVIAADGGRPTPVQALRRELFTLIGAVPLVGPLVALGVWVWMIVAIRSSPLGQGPHDVFAGGTRVVRA